MTETLTAIDALDAVHPHHVTLIQRHNATGTTGAIVTLDGKCGTGTFYTGIKAGDTVVVVDEHGIGCAVGHLDGDSASLSVHSTSGITLTPLHPGHWGADEATAAKRAAEQGATALLERAYTAANRLLGAPGTDEAALDALRQAKELRDYAFAVGIYLTYMRDAEARNA